MCLAKRNLTPNTRRFFVLANLCLASGLVLTVLGKNFSQAHVDLFDGLSGLFIGLSLAFNFAALRFADRCSPKNV